MAQRGDSRPRSPAIEQVREDTNTSQGPPQPKILTETVPFLVSLVLEGKYCHCDTPSPMLSFSRPAPALRLAPLTPNRRLAQNSLSGISPVCHPTSGTRRAHTLQTMSSSIRSVHTDEPHLTHTRDRQTRGNGAAATHQGQSILHLAVAP